MKLLLTSAGVTNASTRAALVDLLGKPIEEGAWAVGISGPAYAIDDDTAITVVDGVVDVVSEGDWKPLRTWASQSTTQAGRRAGPAALVTTGRPGEL